MDSKASGMWTNRTIPGASSHACTYLLQQARRSFCWSQQVFNQITNTMDPRRTEPAAPPSTIPSWSARRTKQKLRNRGLATRRPRRTILRNSQQTISSSHRTIICSRMPPVLRYLKIPVLYLVRTFENVLWLWVGIWVTQFENSNCTFFRRT